MHQAFAYQLGVTDEFELYRARANSGGNLYGLLNGNEEGSTNCLTGNNNHNKYSNYNCNQDNDDDDDADNSDDSESSRSHLRRTKSLTPAMTAKTKRQNLAKLSRDR